MTQLTCATCKRTATMAEWGTYVGVPNAMFDTSTLDVIFECGCAGQEKGVWLRSRGRQRIVTVGIDGTEVRDYDPRMMPAWPDDDD